MVTRIASLSARRLAVSQSNILIVALIALVLTGCRMEVENLGDISGTVTGTYTLRNSSTLKIECGNDGNSCEAGYGGVMEVFTATPAPGYVFAAWTGACEGQDATCNLTFTTKTYWITKAHFNYQEIVIDTIADQQLSQNFNAFTLQANATSSAGNINYSVSNSRPDAINVDIDSASGLITISPLSNQFGNAEISVAANVAGGHSASSRFEVTVAMPTNPVFACGTSVESETGDTLPGSYTLFEFGQTRPLAI
ncbi:MAG: hypothetical protein ACI9B9_000612, partial [Halioglobus sp.]